MKSTKLTVVCHSGRAFGRRLKPTLLRSARYLEDDSSDTDSTSSLNGIGAMSTVGHIVFFHKLAHQLCGLHRF
jgi:hypothetical protein